MTELETKSGNLEKQSVRRVRQFLLDAGYGDPVIELSETARSAQDAATSVGTELGSIVKSLTFMIGDVMIMALVAGDHSCVTTNLARALNLEGDAIRPDADRVKSTTGYSIGGVPPVASKTPLPLVIDHSLKRFETVYAAAGHPHCIFPIAPKDLSRLTGGIISYNIAKPMQ